MKKIEYDVENFSFNTSIPAFMICTNELTTLKCNKRSILEPLVIALSPYAPHITEELWHLMGHTESITTTQFPQWEDKYLVEDNFEYPVSFNGKVRFKLAMPLTATNAEIEAAVKASPEAARWLEGKEIRKMIIRSDRMEHVHSDIRGELFRRSLKMQQEGINVLKLNTGNPATFGFTMAESIRKALEGNEHKAVGYCDFQGMPAARRAICDYHTGKGIQGITPDDIFIGVCYSILQLLRV